MHRSRMFTPFALLGLCFLFPGTLSAGQPSFNCAKASSKAEKAICRSSALAASDATIASDYKKLQANLDPKAAMALAGDERWFVGARDAIADAPEDMSPPDLGAFLKDRIKFLRSVDTNPGDSFAGSWYNVAGGFDITATQDGFKVVGNAANPANANWVCQFDGIGKVSGDVLEVRQSEEGGNSGSNQDPGLQLIREGATLRVKFLPATGSDDSTSPFCGMNGSFEGDYFSVPADYR